MPKTKEISELILMFAHEMRRRFDEADQDGWGGWHSEKAMSKMRPIKERIIKNALNGDWADVANLAMFAWNFEK